MPKISSFEELNVWQKSRDLTNIIYKITSNFPRDERFGLIDQIRRAAVSIMANIAEGFSRYHLAEREELNDLFAKIDEIGKMINGLINATKSFKKAKL